MHWAKAHEGTRYNLGMSGAPPPSPAELRDVFEPGQPGGASSVGDRHGFPGLRADLGTMHGVAPDHVLVSDGTSLANYAALTALAGPGDRVLVETPTYSSLAEIPRFHGAVVERIARRPEDAWVPRIEEIRASTGAGGPPVRAVALTRLHNPTGAGLPAAFLEALAILAEERDFHVLLDEVYLDFVDATPGHRFSPRFLSTGSLTKAWGYGGLRIGWVLGAAEALAPIRELSFHLAVNASAPSQRAARRVLARRDVILARTRALAARGREIAEDWIASRDDATWIPPAGGLVGFVRLPRVPDTAAFTRRLREAEDVALPAGEMFGRPGWVRLGFGLEEPALHEALARVGRALDGAR